MGYTIGIDFDGTVVTHMYPEVGKDIGAVPVLKKLVEDGNRLILFTMRDSRNGTLQDAVNWFKENGIKLYGVNTNPTQAEWTDSPKPHCNIYIDDAGLATPTNFDEESGREYVDWKKVAELLKEKGVFGNDNETNESVKMGKIKITESQLNNLITESVKRILSEADGNQIMKGLFGGENLGTWLRSERDKEGYFVVFCDDYQGQITDEHKIEPCCVLKPEDILPEEDSSVMVNGKEVFIISENSNYYASNGTEYPQAGDLVFEVNGEYAFYRPGLNAAAGFTQANAIVGTRDEVMDYIQENLNDDF